MMSATQQHAHTFSIGMTSANTNSGGMQPMRAVGYCRVSTDMQAMHGLSLDAQRQQIENYAKAYGLKLENVYIEAESGKDIKGRGQFQRMIDQINRGEISTIIAPALDRFTRSQRDFVEFSADYIETGKVNLCLIKESINTNSHSGRQFLPLLVAFAQLERQATAQRVSQTIAYIRSQGGHYGKVPFGYATVQDGRLKRLVRHPENYQWLEKMALWYRAGVSNSDIAQRLNAANIKPCSGKQWTENSVYLVLIREKIHNVRSFNSDKRYDREKAYKIAYTLKAEERSLQFIADELNRKGLRPSKASEYKTHSVQELLRSVPFYKMSSAIGMALYMQAQGKSLRAIAAKLQEMGHKPPRGGQWYAMTVRNLIMQHHKSS